MEKDKKIKIALRLTYIAISLGLLFFLGLIGYYIKGIIGGGGMLGDAIRQSEEAGIELQNIEYKASKVEDLLFCQMIKTQQEKSEHRHFVKRETCSIKRSSEEAKQLRFQMCREIKDELDKSVYGKGKPEYYARYVENGICPEEVLDENEKKEVQAALIEVKKINKMNEVGRKISTLHTCKIKAGLITPKPGETAKEDQSTYEDYVKWGHCPRKTELKKIEEHLNQLCVTIKQVFDSLENKKEIEMKYRLYIGEDCKN